MNKLQLPAGSITATIRFIDTLASSGEPTTATVQTTLQSVSAAELVLALQQHDAERCDLPLAECAPYLVAFFQDNGQGVATFVVRTTGFGPAAADNFFCPGVIEYA
jgi:hypothetical protein